ncbi:MAG: hypothetical protein N2508_08710 [Anaerolineae bacterium]|nr:hypothetical protein [Anaerolineae bacterium]
MAVTKPCWAALTAERAARKMKIFLALIVALLVACGGAVTPATPTPADTAKTVLEKVAEIICYDHPKTTSFFERDTTYGFYCSPAAGHFTITSLEWFNTESDARAAFDTHSEGLTVGEFHGAPLLIWSTDHPSFPGGRSEYRTWLWVMQQWLIRVQAFDDTHFTVAPDPGKVSEAIYQVGLEYGLFTVNER